VYITFSSIDLESASGRGVRGKKKKAAAVLFFPNAPGGERRWAIRSRREGGRGLDGTLLRGKKKKGERKLSAWSDAEGRGGKSSQARRVDFFGAVAVRGGGGDNAANKERGIRCRKAKVDPRRKDGSVILLLSN